MTGRSGPAGHLDTKPRHPPPTTAGSHHLGDDGRQSITQSGWEASSHPWLVPEDTPRDRPRSFWWPRSDRPGKEHAGMNVATGRPTRREGQGDETNPIEWAICHDFAGSAWAPSRGVKRRNKPNCKNGGVLSVVMIAGSGARAGARRRNKPSSRVDAGEDVRPAPCRCRVDETNPILVSMAGDGESRGPAPVSAAPAATKQTHLGFWVNLADCRAWRRPVDSRPRTDPDNPPGPTDRAPPPDPPAPPPVGRRASRRPSSASSCKTGTRVLAASRTLHPTGPSDGPIRAA